MMTNKGNYLAAADHELECDILQVGGASDRFEILTWRLKSGKLFQKKPSCQTCILIHKQVS